MTDKPNILIVEDDAFLRTMLADELAEHGFAVLQAGNGIQALDILGTLRVDLMITDIFMPNMEGIELIRALRKRLPDLPVFAVSGGTKSMDKSVILGVARKLGANEVFAKPLDNAALIAMIRQYLGGDERLDKAAAGHDAGADARQPAGNGTVPKDTEETRDIAVVFDNVPDALLLLFRATDGTWRIASCNRAAAEMFGTLGDRLIGMTLEDIFGVGAVSRDGRPLPEICRETAAPIEEESYLAARREDFWVEFNWWRLKFVPVPSENGSIDQVAGICQLVTHSRQMRESLKQFTSAISQASSIIAIVELDGTIEFINPAFEAMTGISSAAAVGRGIVPLCMPAAADSLYAPMLAAIERLEPWQGELPSEKADGTLYWENVRISPIQNENGVADRYLFIKEDITNKRQIESQLKLASRVLETTDAGVIITDPQGRIESVNPAFTAITGYEVDEVVGKTPQILRSGMHDREFFAGMWQQLASEGRWSGEFLNRKKNGDIFVSSMSISALHAPDGSTTHYVGVFSDVTTLKDSQKRLENLANYDALTGLPNRHHVLERLNYAVMRAKREERNVALMYFDLDHFKVVNDTLGHPAGDALLKEVSARALDQMRDEDTLARLGGDEFVAILESIADPERIAAVAERIIADIKRVFMIQGNEVYVGCSIGIAFYPKDGEDVDTLMRNADLALYRAKEDGRNCFRLYSDELNRMAHLRYMIENRLRKAIDLAEMSIAYQPQFDGSSRSLTGAEALLRWVSAETGQISPTVFIPIAEQTGAIVPIGQWVMEQVCLMQRRVMDTGMTPAKVAVNVSPVQFKQKDIVESFLRIVEKTGVTPQCIEIEVTEGAIMVDPDSAIETLNRLRRHGFSIAVDDFGTGYSSLGYLKRFPIDKLKIDRTFVRDLESDPDDAVIISAIIAMSHSLGMKVLAEGVETEKQLEYLNNAGCEEVQGYLTGRPMPESEFMDTLRQNRVCTLAAA